MVPWYLYGVIIPTGKALARVGGISRRPLRQSGFAKVTLSNLHHSHEPGCGSMRPALRTRAQKGSILCGGRFLAPDRTRLRWPTEGPNTTRAWRHMKRRRPLLHPCGLVSPVFGASPSHALRISSLGDRLTRREILRRDHPTSPRGFQQVSPSDEIQKGAGDHLLPPAVPKINLEKPCHWPYLSERRTVMSTPGLNTSRGRSVVSVWKRASLLTRRAL